MIIGTRYKPALVLELIVLLKEKELKYVKDIQQEMYLNITEQIGGEILY